MEKIQIDLPFLYGDHHVTEVRKILSLLPGIDEIYVSSNFHMVELSFDPDLLDLPRILASLEESGYLGETVIPVEKGVSTTSDASNLPFFRHTNNYVSTPKVVSFTQDIAKSGRHVWPCPGMGVILSVNQSK
jgi:hypothetical protein